MEIGTATALVTGSNRGLGRALARALDAAGARKIYAAARDPAAASDLADGKRVFALELDVTDEAQVAAAAVRAGDVDLLINNAGRNFNVPLIASDGIDAAREEIETNYLGTLRMCRAFAPVLAANGGGMIVNVISMLARVSIPAIGSVCGSKAALLLMTAGVRAELARQGTRVMGVLPGPIDTDMTPGGESSPADVADAILRAVAADEEEIWPGPMAERVREGLLADPKAVEKEFAAYLPE